MAVRPGYRRLKEFDYLTELSEEARESLDVPEDAIVTKIIDEFRSGGPIVVTYTRPTTEEQRKENRRRLQYAIDDALDKVAERCACDAEYYERLKAELGIPG